ncbi:MAG: alpha/beta hydrolase [Lachnospiraceae bacterium]|nr:alpha/beta hydrolase [Lachnospiraceae bacterium]
MDNKLAVFFPGIGYHIDKPLLYYSRKLAASFGYRTADISYTDMPMKIKGDPVMMKKAASIAFEQASKQLDDLLFEGCDDLIFAGKSIGTVALAKYAKEHSLNVKQIWYTPVEATLGYASSDVISFIGDADPWSDVEALKKRAESAGIELYSYSDCNHSLETGDALTDIKNLMDVMKKTSDFLAR